MAQVSSSRPSDERRRALTDAEGDMMGGERGVPLVSNFFPVERYCAAADKVLESFRSAYDDRRLDDAYVLGKRFCSFSLDALPTHDYFRSPKLANWRDKNSQDMDATITKLEQVAKWMDEEELERQTHYAQQLLEEQRRYRELQQVIHNQRQKKQQRAAVSNNIEQSALSKLKLLNQNYGIDHQHRPSQLMQRRPSSESTDSGDSSIARKGDRSSPQSSRRSKQHHMHDIADVRSPTDRRGSLDRTLSRRSFTRDGSRDSLDIPRRGHSGKSPSRRRNSDFREDDNESYRSSRSNRSRKSRNGESTERSQPGTESFTSEDRRRHLSKSGSRRASMSGGDESGVLRRSTMDHHSSGNKPNLESALSKLKSAKLDERDSNRILTSDRSRRRQGGSPSEEPLPPPIPPPTTNGGSAVPPPPSYNQVMGQDKLSHVNRLYERTTGIQRSIATPAGGAHVAGRRGPSVTYPHQGVVSLNRSSQDRDTEVGERPTAPVAQERVPVRKVRDRSISDYERMIAEEKIVVYTLDTYQGRLPQSTNGCTVISPLVVSHHLKSQGSVADDTIVNVIDRQCGPLLREIRSKLELEGSALIIPSDVHDHLVDKKILSQSNFIGAIGGNILDQTHVGGFLKMLQAGEEGSHTNKRTGAALFFHEHVVSIVKVPVARGKFAFDLVDSMPGDKRRATRTRCRDLAAIDALIRWYAFRKFSESNIKYIDHNAWDENMADFDPRVFQAFVWAE